MTQQSIIVRARKDGYDEAKVELRKVVFDYLEAKYMSPDVERGTPQAELLLTITLELSELLKVQN